MKVALAAMMAVARGSVAHADTSVLLIRGMAPTFGGGSVPKMIGLKYEAPADAQAAAALLTRIETVAGQICTDTAGGKSENLAERVAKCKETAVHMAVKDVSSPALSALAQ